MSLPSPPSLPSPALPAAPVSSAAPADPASATPGLEAARPTVLVVDDSPEILALIHGLLKDRHRVKIATSGDKALRIAAQEPRPDLILLDVLMPTMDGYELCRWLKADALTRDIPVIFLTARSDVADESHGLALGAVDYISKPISPPILMARVRNQLQLKASADFLRDKAAFLEAEIARRTAELSAIQDVTVLALASLAEARQAETRHHLRRTQHFVQALARALQHHPRFEATLTEDSIATLFRSVPLHDIGKLGLPDALLRQTGPYTADERAHMREHPRLGRDAIAQAQAQLGTPAQFLAMAQDIAYSHQEKWDGTGYPEGLKGEQIPLAARLMALADTYDALTTARPYRPAISHEQACEVIARERGRHFDPEVVDAFAQVHEQFREIAQRYP